MPNIDFTFIMLADSPILPLWITDIIGFVMRSAVFLFCTSLVWVCWLAIKSAAFLIKKYESIIDINYSKRSSYPGVKSIDGIDMLIYQAIFSVNYWFRTTIDIDIRQIKKHINNA